MLYQATDNLPPEEVGVKARRLAELRILGYTVPVFVVVSVSLGRQLVKGLITAEDFAALLAEKLPIGRLSGTTYAVRSAALREDTNTKAYAGMFSSYLCVPEDNLYTTVCAVLADAAAKNNPAMSVIIQEYVQPTYAGVLFTRNPVGGPEVVVEYVTGNGEAAVGGGAVTRVVFAGTYDVNQATVWQQKLVATAQQIEQHYSWPQDIEWALRDGILYILQTRPITTITKSRYQAYLHIDQTYTGNYHLARATNAETFATPSPLMFSLLQRLYATEGAIETAYRAVGMRYQDTNQFSLLGADLFIDREAELRSVHPARSFFTNKTGVPAFESFTGAFMSYKNSWQLERLGGAADLRTLYATIKQKIQTPLPPSHSLSELIARVNTEYLPIFLINLHTSVMYQKLKRLIPNDYPRTLHPLDFELSYQALFTSLEQLELVPGVSVGNSLSLDDTSLFYIPPKPNNVTGEVVDTTSVPRLLRPVVSDYTARAQKWSTARELARWYSVRLRTYLSCGLAQFYPTITLDLLRFATISQLESEAITQELLAGYKATSLQMKKLDFPLQFASRAVLITPKHSALVCISPGRATGRLVVVCDIGSFPDEPIILSVSALTPELVALLPKLSGIVCATGGVLSHLAIVAREVGIPVLQTTSPLETLIGHIVTIDATHLQIQIT